MANGPGTGQDDCKAYINVAGTYEAPNWTELDLFNDVTLPKPKEKAEAGKRGSKFKGYKPTVMDFVPTANMIRDNSDPNYLLLDAAFWADTTVDLCFMDGDVETAGSKGIRGTFYVTKFDDGEARGEFATTDAEFSPAFGAAHDVEQYVITT